MVGYREIRASEEKMQNDEEFHADYTSFMKNIFIIGYATDSIFFNWDLLHAKLNSHYNSWSYKKKKHKKIKGCRKSL